MTLECSGTAFYLCCSRPVPRVVNGRGITHQRGPARHTKRRRRRQRCLPSAVSPGVVRLHRAARGTVDYPRPLQWATAADRIITGARVRFHYHWDMIVYPKELARNWRGIGEDLAEIIAVYGPGVVAALLLGGLLIKLARDLFRTAGT